MGWHFQRHCVGVISVSILSVDFQPISYSSKYVKTLEATLASESSVEQNLPPVAFKLPTFVTHHTHSCLDICMYTS